ncbi:MAG: glycoside hydrolase [Marinobacter sp. 34-60-7]|nr:MAG: glycoside hydrolase [Marinobacter sp. 34-60-7]
MASVHPRTIVVWICLLALTGCASQQSLPPASQSWSPAASSARTDALWDVFQRYEGTPYRYGGTTADGFDCSGFINAAYREALGQPLPRTTSQMLRQGQPVPAHQIQPGDLVFFRIGGKEQHAGIYMGDNRFIHASTSVGVTLSQLNGYYWADRFTEARRFPID